MQVDCSACGGSGGGPDPETACSSCRGWGSVRGPIECVACGSDIWDDPYFNSDDEAFCDDACEEEYDRFYVRDEEGDVLDEELDLDGGVECTECGDIWDDPHFGSAGEPFCDSKCEEDHQAARLR